jgi:pimeloyl-ACP methyl ester carboxylesterase
VTGSVAAPDGVPVRYETSGKFPTNLAANRRHAPGFNAVIMKGVGHYLMLEDPQRFGDLLAEALRRIETARTAQ